MNIKWSRIKCSLTALFGIDRLTAEFLNFSKSHLCFIVAVNIHSVFINILLMRSSGNVNITLYYNMINYICSGIGMQIGGLMVKRMYLKYVTFLGIGLHLAAYLFFLLFMENIASFFIPIAVLIGFGGGFFWYTYMNALSLYSEDDTREASIAFIGIFAGIVALFVPTIAGSIIGMFVDYTGYMIMFGCAFIISGIALYLFTKLPKREPEHNQTRYRWCYRRLFTSKCWRLQNAQIFLRSIRDGVFGFFLNVLLFQYVQNEALIGLNTFLAGFITVISQFLCGRIVTAKNRVRIMLGAVTVLLCGSLILLTGLTALTIILLSIVNAFFVVFLMNPATAIDFFIIQTQPDGYTCRGEYLGIFEMTRGIGRCVGIAFVLFLPKTAAGYVTALVSITVIQYLTIFCASHAQKEAKRLRDARKKPLPPAIEKSAVIETDAKEIN